MVKEDLEDILVVASIFFIIGAVAGIGAYGTILAGVIASFATGAVAALVACLIKL